MEGGSIVEIGKPQELMFNQDTYFYKLSKSAGIIQ